MKYWELIKSNSYNVNKANIIDKNYCSYGVNDNESYELTEDEVNVIMSELVRLHDKYFSDIPFASNMSKRFIWNIPREVYEFILTVKNDHEMDSMNPLYWFFIFCTDNIGYNMAKFIVSANMNISDDDYDNLLSLSDIYDADNGIINDASYHQSDIVDIDAD